MKIVSLREPCYVKEPETDVKHLPATLCKRMFGWDSPCQGIEFFIKDEVPDVEFYAIVEVKEEGVILAATGELGMHHYFIPWSNILAVHGHIAT